MKNWIDDVQRLIAEGQLVATFSKNCYSGIVSVLGKDTKCLCYRCCIKRGETPTEETESQAAENSARAQKLVRELVKAYFCEKQ